MFKFEYIYNDDAVECPYCGFTYQPEKEDYSEDLRSEECAACSKNYYLRQSFFGTHETSPDCGLNSEPHDYQPMPLSNGLTAPFCTVCGKCQPIKERK